MNDKKSILEKWGIIQKIEIDETDSEQLSTFIESVTAEQPAVAEEQFFAQEPAFDVDKFVSTQELYDVYGLNHDGTNTIFIIDSYNKALPDALPFDVRKRTVTNLITATGLDMETLTQDGADRIQKLNDFFDSFRQRTDDVIESCENEIQRLEEYINEYKNRISGRKKLQEKQKATIDYEVKKLQDILSFIKD